MKKIPQKKLKQIPISVFENVQIFGASTIGQTIDIARLPQLFVELGVDLAGLGRVYCLGSLF